MNELNEKEYKQSDFWKYGISGDIPIILVKVQYINDVYVVREILKIHEILRAKGIKLDICILDYEKNVYESESTGKVRLTGKGRTKGSVPETKHKNESLPQEERWKGTRLEDSQVRKLKGPRAI